MLEIRSEEAPRSVCVFSALCSCSPSQAAEFAPTPSHKTATGEQAGQTRDRGRLMLWINFLTFLELTD